MHRWATPQDRHNPLLIGVTSLCISIMSIEMCVSSPRPLPVCRLDRVGGTQGPSLQAALHGDLLQGESGPVSAATRCQATSPQEETQIRPPGPQHPQ